MPRTTRTTEPSLSGGIADNARTALAAPASDGLYAPSYVPSARRVPIATAQTDEQAIARVVLTQLEALRTRVQAALAEQKA